MATTKKATAARKPAAKPASAETPGSSGPTSSPASQAAKPETGFAGAVVDPRDHRMVTPDDLTMGADTPANPAPEPS